MGTVDDVGQKTSKSPIEDVNQPNSNESEQSLSEIPPIEKALNKKASLEKLGPSFMEDVEKTDHEIHVPQRYTEEQYNGVIRKLDWNIMPMILVLYSLSVLDRSNLGNARLAGLEDDVNLGGKRYDWLGTIFYIAYILSQWTQIGWKAFRPHIWIACAVFLWGVISTLQATATGWGALMVCRVGLGIAEAMYGPGVSRIISYLCDNQYSDSSGAFVFELLLPSRAYWASNRHFFVWLCIGKCLWRSSCVWHFPSKKQCRRAMANSLCR